MAGNAEEGLTEMQIQIDADKAQITEISKAADVERTEHNKILADLQKENAKYDMLVKAYKVLDVKVRAHTVSLQL